MDSGIIAVEEEREKINAVSKKYIELYKKSLERDKKIDDIANVSRWGVRIGSFIGHIKVAFSGKSWLRKTIDHGLIRISSKLSMWGIKKIAEKQKKDNVKEREKIEAAFIEDDGTIKEFLLQDKDIVDNQEIVQEQEMPNVLAA